jgi:Flp pilus assembly protein TadG
MPSLGNGLTLIQAKQQLDYWLKASQLAAQGQSYSISTEGGSRSLSRANAKDILAQITFWQRQVNRLSRGGIQVTPAVPMD